MKVFIIPSWYPSTSNPIYGTFNEEQALLLAKERPQWSVGVSTWGQGDARFLIWARRPSSFRKLFATYSQSKTTPIPNLSVYFSPAYTWTRKVRKGNIQGIIHANEQNLLRFMDDVGKPDIISAQASYPASLIAHFLSRKYQIPYTVTARMSPFPLKEFLRKGQLKPLLLHPLREANRLIATSESLKRRMEDLGLTGIAIVNNPIDLDFFRPTSAKGGEPSVLTVGRIEVQKGIDLLLHAFSRLPTSLQWTLRIGGDGSLLAAYQQLAQQLGIAGQVRWLGSLSRREVRDEMQRCSFYVLSSRHETFGNVVLEAMACGKPVVATRCGGPEEIVTVSTGHLCEIDATDLAKTMERMCTSYQTDFDAATIRREVQDRFSPAHWTGRLESLFRKVAGM